MREAEKIDPSELVAILDDDLRRQLIASHIAAGAPPELAAEIAEVAIDCANKAMDACAEIFAFTIAESDKLDGQESPTLMLGLQIVSARMTAMAAAIAASMQGQGGRVMSMPLAPSGGLN